MSYDPVAEQKRWALQYIVDSDEEQTIKTRRSVLRDDLVKWIKANCDRDENGNYIYEFDSPIRLDDNSYLGLMAQRRVSEFINEDRAWEIIDKYGAEVRAQCVDEVVTHELNLDMMYALNQRGIISDEDIDSILETNETFALVKLKD